MAVISTLPYGGRYFGMCVPSPDVIAYLYDTKAAIRFRAEHSGNVTSVRWWNRTNGSGESGFHTGTGGSIRVDIESDSGGLPSGTILRSSATQVGAATLGAFPLVALTSPLSVTRDTTYHIVIRQLASGAGTVSLQSLDTRPNGSPQFPFDVAWAVLRSSGASYAQTNAYEVPIFECVYADGIIKGQGYIGGDRPDSTVTIGGQTRARQKFVPTFNTTATAVQVWVSRVHTAALDLTVTLRNVSNTTLSGQVLASGSAANSGMALATDSPVNWERIGLTTPVTFVAGQTYYAVLTAPVGAQWRIQAGGNGSATFLFNEDKAYSWGGRALALAEDTRRAEWSGDGGVSWLPWRADVFGDGADLPILFELVEQPDPAPEPEPEPPPVIPPPIDITRFKGSKAGHGRGGSFSFMSVGLGGGTGIVANPDNASVATGAIATIPVLTNDVPNTGITLDGIEVQATQGTATVVGDNVRYASTAPFTGTDTFRYRSKRTSDGATSRALVTVNVTGAGSGELPGDEMPTPVRTLPTVNNRSDLVSRYATAIGGDLIKVANGVNLGGFDFNRNGDNAGRPIMVAIDGAAPTSATRAYFSGPVTMTGRYNMLWGLRGMAQVFRVTGQGCRLRRILWSGARIRNGDDHPMQVDLEGPDLSVEYCEITDNDSRGISFHGACRRGKIIHTYFHDFTVNLQDQTFEALQVGRRGSDYGEGDSLANGNEVGWCFFDNINQNNNEGETPSLKHPYVHMHDCHFNNARNPTLRLSTHSLYERIRCTGESFFVVAGPFHTLVNCAVAHSQGYQLLSGTVNSETDSTPGVEHPSTSECRMHNCSGTVRVGVRYGDPGYTIPARKIYILGHRSGSIVNAQDELVPQWETSQTSTEPVETPPTYTSTSQGLLAGL